VSEPCFCKQGAKRKEKMRNPKADLKLEPIDSFHGCFEDTLFMFLTLEHTVGEPLLNTTWAFVAKPQGRLGL
jgi:hypothetical protein